MLRNYLIYITLIASTMLFSCTSPEEKKQKTEGEKTYEQFAGFVEAVEKNAGAEVKDTSAAQQEVDALKREYNNYDHKINELRDQFTPHQQVVLLDLRERFTIAMEKKQQKRDETKRRYVLRNELLGIDVQSDDLSEVTPENIKKVYQHFVNTISQNTSSYTQGDWEMIEGFWAALNMRKEQLVAQLSPADTTSIAKKEKQYLEVKEKQVKP